MTDVRITLFKEGDITVVLIERPEEASGSLPLIVDVMPDELLPQEDAWSHLRQPFLIPFLDVGLRVMLDSSPAPDIGALLRSVDLYEKRSSRPKHWHLRNQAPRAPLPCRPPSPTMHRRLQRGRNQ